MRVVTFDNLTARSLVQPTIGLTLYDFRTLSPLDFEDLVRDLLQAELGETFESFKPGRDQGIDFRFASSSGNTIVQAKHYVGSGFAAFMRACKVENTKVVALRPQRYLLATSIPLSPVQKNAILQAMPSTPLVAADIFGPQDLNAILGRHPDIERRHFKLWLASSAVLERILHSGVYNRTETELALIRSMTPRFVNNDSVGAAEQILARSGTLIISGEPGVGKTTLARMLVWLHAEQGWKISVIDDIREAFELPLDEGRQLIFFDDFLGQVALSSDLVRSMDQRFPPFLQKVRAHDNLRFILTTRDYILRQAQAFSGRLAAPMVNSSEFVLDVGRYTRSVRAKMLFNHLFFSEMTKSDLNALMADDFFLRIVDHRNFNPRLIDLLTSPDYLSLANKPIKAIVQSVLDNPAELWERPYRTQLGREARAMMLSLYFNGPTTKLADLEQTFDRMLDATGADVPTSERPAQFRNTLRELEGSVLAIQDRQVRFSNPGVRDFLDRAVQEDRLLPSAAEALTTYSELEQCWSSAMAAAEDIGPEFPAIWAEAVARMIIGGTGTELQRLELVLESFEELREPALLRLVSAAANDLEEAELSQDDGDRCSSLLESVPRSVLPEQQMLEVRDAVSTATGQLLRSWGGYMTLEDLETLAGKLTQFGSRPSDTLAACQVALKDFVDLLDEVLREIDDLDELDDLEQDLAALMTKYGCTSARAHRDIEYRRQAIYDGRVREGRASYGTYGGGAEKPDISDDEIRSMFSGLSH